MPAVLWTFKNPFAAALFVAAAFAAAVFAPNGLAGGLPQPRAPGNLPTGTIPPGDVLGLPGHDSQTPAARGAGKQSGMPEQAPWQKRQLDDLFRRLAAANDPAEAEGIAGAIRRVWLHSGSDTADLLIGRAGTAMSKQKMDLAEQLLDSLVALEPNWAEAWNRRATVRFHREDDRGAMADIAQVLVREPRHFGALSGMGHILERHNMRKDALKVFRLVLALYPQQQDIRKIVAKLKLEIEGRDT